MSNIPIRNKYQSPSASVRQQDPKELDAQRTYYRDTWMSQLKEITSKYNLKIAQPFEKWDTTYASELPSGLPPRYWDAVPPRPTFYDGTKTETGLQDRMLTVNPASGWSQGEEHADLNRNNSPSRQRFVHRETWNNKNRAGY